MAAQLSTSPSATQVQLITNYMRTISSNADHDNAVTNSLNGETVTSRIRVTSVAYKVEVLAFIAGPEDKWAVRVDVSTCGLTESDDIYNMRNDLREAQVIMARTKRFFITLNSAA